MKKKMDISLLFVQNFCLFFGIEGKAWEKIIHCTWLHPINISISGYIKRWRRRGLKKKMDNSLLYVQTFDCCNIFCFCFGIGIRKRKGVGKIICCTWLHPINISKHFWLYTKRCAWSERFSRENKPVYPNLHVQFLEELKGSSSL